MPQTKGAFRAKSPCSLSWLKALMDMNRLETSEPANPILSSSIKFLIWIIFSLFFLPSLLSSYLSSSLFLLLPPSSILYPVFFHFLYCLRAQLYHRWDGKKGTFHIQGSLVSAPSIYTTLHVICYSLPLHTPYLLPFLSFTPSPTWTCTMCFDHAGLCHKFWICFIVSSSCVLLMLLSP